MDTIQKPDISGTPKQGAREQKLINQNKTRLPLKCVTNKKLSSAEDPKRKVTTVLADEHVAIKEHSS